MDRSLQTNKTNLVGDAKGPQPTRGESFRHYQRRRRDAVEEELFRRGKLCTCTGLVVFNTWTGLCSRCGKVVDVTWRMPWPD